MGAPIPPEPPVGCPDCWPSLPSELLGTVFLFGDTFIGPLYQYPDIPIYFNGEPYCPETGEYVFMFVAFCWFAPETLLLRVGREYPGYDLYVIGNGCSIPAWSGDEEVWASIG